jgi:putative copper resistance protein D
MMEPDRLAIVLRALAYAAALGAAGGVLFAVSFPRAATYVERSLRRQILLGCALLIFIEPLRYVVFQLAVSEGDWSVAFAPGMRWMALQTAIGQAAVARLLAAFVMLATALRWPGISLAAGLVMIASFALEGHTMSSGYRLLLAPLLFIHFAAVSWWLGALYPLLALTRQAPQEVAAKSVRAFGQRAAWVVGALFVAGVALLIVLTRGEFRPDSAYQQRFVIKLVLVAVLLSLAAWNKLRLTPLLSENYSLGAAKLRRSIRCEIAVASVILATTAWIISTSPTE